MAEKKHFFSYFRSMVPQKDKDVESSTMNIFCESWKFSMEPYSLIIVLFLRV